MDLNSFKSDEEIIEYLKIQVERIVTVNECHLFREEQMVFSEEMLRFRNCIEWLIRINTLIKNIRYALMQGLRNANEISGPLEETEQKTLYSYYLEDAVYRDMVLWDIFRQLLNEYYKCGYSENEKVNIYNFFITKKSKIGVTQSNRILRHINNRKHKIVRNKLRNSFTHSVDATSSYIFHRKTNGKMQAQLDYMLPTHPFENIYLVTQDVLKLIDFINGVVEEMFSYRNDNLALFKVFTTMPCGKIVDDYEYWNLGTLKQNYERIIVPCETPCENASSYNEAYVCKPVNIYYRRIRTQQGELDGEFIPQKHLVK